MNNTAHLSTLTQHMMYVVYHGIVYCILYILYIVYCVLCIVYCIIVPPSLRRMTVGKACLWFPATTRTRTSRAPQADALSRYALQPCRRLYGVDSMSYRLYGVDCMKAVKAGVGILFCPTIVSFLFSRAPVFFPSTFLCTHTHTHTTAVLSLVVSAIHVVSHVTTRRTSAVYLCRLPLPFRSLTRRVGTSKEGSKIPTTPFSPPFLPAHSISSLL